MSPELRTTEDLERLRRSVAMLPPGQPALDREDALDLHQRAGVAGYPLPVALFVLFVAHHSTTSALLAELQEVRRDLDRLESGLLDRQSDRSIR